MLNNEPTRFKSNLKSLVGCLGDCLNVLNKHGKTDLTSIITNGATAMIEEDKDEVKFINTFIERSNDECWEMARIRNVDFFNNNSSILFGDMTNDYLINEVKKVILKNDKGEYIIGNELINEAWEIIQTLIKISIKYLNKNPNIKVKIDTKKQIEAWKIKL